MSGAGESFDIVAITGGGGPTPSSFTLDLCTIKDRVAILLRRDDMDDEIKMWINFAQRELVDRVNFPEMRALNTFTLSDGTFRYTLPDDFMRPDRCYYKQVLATPVWGRNLWALPRSWYADAEIERRVNTGSQAKGDLLHYIIDGSEIIFYPVPNKAANVEMTYYKLPTDMVNCTDLPSIAARYRHYLIWLTYFWGQVFLEKDDMNKLVIWQRKFDQVIADVKRIVNRKENRDQMELAPITGLEEASRLYGGGGN